MLSGQKSIEIDLINYKKREEKENKKICLFLCVLMVSLFVINTGDILSELVRGAVTRDYISLFMKVLCAVFFANCIPVVVKHFTVDKLLITFISLTVYIVNLFFNNPQLTNTAVTFYSMCFTGFLAAGSISDYEMVERYLLFGSRIVGVLGIIVLGMNFLGIIISLKTVGYNMGMGYSCIICIMLLLWNAIRGNTICDYIFSGGLLILVFLYGSRGPLLGISLFIIFFGLRFFSSRKQYIKGVLVLLIILTFLIFHEQILLMIENFLNARGISSRNAYLFAHSFNHDSGRNDIWNTLKAEIVRNPFSIRGINADYLVVGTYAHNIFIELLYEHGVILGGICCLYITYKIICTLRLDVISAKSVLGIIFMFSSIPSLMISGSLWTTQNFWIWLAIIVQVSNSVKSKSGRKYGDNIITCKLENI